MTAASTSPAPAAPARQGSAQRLVARVDLAVEAGAHVLGRVVDRAAGPAFAAVRRGRGIARVGPVVVVARREDVEEVLGDPLRFPVDLYAPKMTAVTGPFLLGLDGGPLYRHDRAALDAAIRPADVPDVTALMLEVGRELVVAARRRGRIDVVGELADPAVAHVAGAYLGAPGPDAATSLRWARDVFEELFIDVGDLRATRGRARAAAAAWRPHLDQLIRARKAELLAGHPVPDDVLTRLLRGAGGDAPRLRDIAVRHNLLGLNTGWLPTVPNAFARALDELLRRPPELAGAQEAARAGDLALVGAYVLEASRFRPQNVALLRRVPEDVVIAAGTPRETHVPAGSVVVAATLSAMHDEAAVEAPGVFRTDRPQGDGLLFGHGLHTCYGRHLVRAQLPALAAALFEGPTVRRAPGRSGRLTSTGAYPSHLVVRFDV